MATFVCNRKCYHNLRIYKVGEKLEAKSAPKWFTRVGGQPEPQVAPSLESVEGGDVNSKDLFE
jgi:hypothetical protein